MIEENTLKDLLLKILVNGGEPRKRLLNAINGLLIAQQEQTKVWEDNKEFNSSFFKSQAYYDTLKDEEINNISYVLFSQLFK